MRLFDKLAGMGSIKIREKFRKLPNDFAVLSIDQIAQHYAMSEQLLWGPDDYPYAKCPWRTCFVEWNAPAETKTERGIIKQPTSAQMGAYVISFTGVKQLEAMFEMIHQLPDEREQVRKTGATCGTLIAYHGFSRETGAGSIEILHILYQADDGRVLSTGAKGPGLYRMAGKVGMDLARRHFESMSHVICLAFTFANCANVKLDDVTAQQEPSPAIRRRLKIPSVKRYTLNIQGRSTSRRSGSPEESQEGIMPWHLCRGHFATYTAEKPLFGKHVGKYWIPPHMKGKKENGEVVKDYAIAD